MHATGSVLVAWRKRLPKRRLTRNTIVAVRGPEGWRCAAIHNGRVRPVGVPAPDSFPARTARVLVRASRALHLGCAGGPARPASRRVHHGGLRRPGRGATLVRRTGVASPSSPSTRGSSTPEPWRPPSRCSPATPRLHPERGHATRPTSTVPPAST